MTTEAVVEKDRLSRNAHKAPGTEGATSAMPQPLDVGAILASGRGIDEMVMSSMKGICSICSYHFLIVL